MRMRWIAFPVFRIVGQYVHRIGILFLNRTQMDTDFQDIIAPCITNATEIEVGRLLHFGPTPGIKRRVFDNFRK